MVWGFVKRVIDYFEKNDAPLILFVVTFFSTIFIRNLFEVFSTGYEPGMDKHYHYVLFYTAIVPVFIILFHYATKERILSVSKILLSFFILVLLAPLLDILLNLGTKTGIEYMLPSTTESVLISFLTFFGQTSITLGLRLEVGFMVILSFVYFLFKTNNVLRSLVFSFLLYLVLFFFGSLPITLDFLFSSYNFDISMQVYYHIVYTIITFFSLLWIGYLYDKSKFIALLKDIRALRIMHYLLFFIFGLSVALNWSFDFRFFNYVEIFLCFIAITSGCLFSLFTNNMADYKIDKISNKTRPSVTGLISNREYIVLSVFALIFAIMFSILVGYYFMFLILAFIGLYFLYSMPPWRLKRVPVISKFMIAFNTLIVFLMGYYYIEETLLVPGEYKIFIVFILGLVINFIDIKDYKGDKHGGIMTLPTLLGKRKSQYLIGSFFFLAHVVAYFLFDILEGAFLFSLLFISGVVQFYLVSRKKYSEKPIFILYFILFLFLGIYFILT